MEVPLILSLRAKLPILLANGIIPQVATLHIENIQSLDAPELTIYRTLRRPEEHERAGVLVAANVKVLHRLLASRYPVLSVLLTPEWFEKLEPKLRARPENIQVYIGEKRLLEDITGYQLHQGVLAVAKIPTPPSFEHLLETSPRPRLIVAVEGIASAENLGTLVRNCAAFGVHFLVVSETSCSPYQRRAVSGSMGTLFEQPVVQVAHLVETLSTLCAHGVRCLAAHPRPNSTQLSRADLKRDCCLVFGAEGPGLTTAVLDVCDETIEIPMPSHINSLNVASATAVFLYESSRQRNLLD